MFWSDTVIKLTHIILKYCKVKHTFNAEQNIGLGLGPTPKKIYFFWLGHKDKCTKRGDYYRYLIHQAREVMFKKGFPSNINGCRYWYTRM